MGIVSSAQNEATSILRVSQVLNELSRELQQATEHSARHTPGKTAEPFPIATGDGDRQSVLREAESLYNSRRRWERTFGDDSDLLHDPALDMLLYLFIAGQRHSEVSVSSACYAANAPQTTGLRYVAKLLERGLAIRTDDPFDRRRHLLELTEAGDRLIRRCLESA